MIWLWPPGWMTKPQLQWPAIANLELHLYAAPLEHSTIQPFWPFIMKVNFVWFFLGGSPLCEAKHRSAGQFLMLYDARHGSVSFGQEQGKTSWQCWPGKSVLVGRFWHRHRSDPMDTMDRLGLSWIGSDRIG